ncbi:MAG: hypothetical protein CBCREVIR_1623 [Candidatus Burkholderia crenata]|nr:MAG: hypothetical protein CBCREVIR_1623 [Candidatus Burkholderia crenata]
MIPRNLYQCEIGELLLPKPDFGGAATFYVIYIAGLVNGAVFGIVAYVTYDLINLATPRLKRAARLP